jgi:hypothetical protein
MFFPFGECAIGIYICHYNLHAFNTRNETHNQVVCPLYHSYAHAAYIRMGKYIHIGKLILKLVLPISWQMQTPEGARSITPVYCIIKCLKVRVASHPYIVLLNVFRWLTAHITHTNTQMYRHMIQRYIVLRNIMHYCGFWDIQIHKYPSHIQTHTLGNFGFKYPKIHILHLSN